MCIPFLLIKPRRSLGHAFCEQKTSGRTRWCTEAGRISWTQTKGLARPSRKSCWSHQQRQCRRKYVIAAIGSRGIAIRKQRWRRHRQYEGVASSKGCSGACDCALYNLMMFFVFSFFQLYFLFFDFFFPFLFLFLFDISQKKKLRNFSTTLQMALSRFMNGLHQILSWLFGLNQRPPFTWSWWKREKML